MPWVLPALAIASVVAQTGATAAGMARSNAQAEQQNALSRSQLDLEQRNQVQQQIVQAMVNQRAVAGSQDAFGSTTRYDPTTNQWVSDLGALPKAADTAAMQAGVTRDTTDLQNQELLNQIALRRGAQAGPAADTAARNLADYRPMQSQDLVGLLTNQYTTAARQAYDPLRADVLRSTARTGTAAAPILAQIGRGEAENLRNSLRDAMISGMTNVEGINQTRRSGLESAATTASQMANPQLGASGITPSTNQSTMAQLLNQRAGNAAISTAYGARGANEATAGTSAGYNAARSTVPDPNFGLNQAISGLKDLSQTFKPGGQLSDALGSLLGGGKGYNDVAF